MLMRIAITLSIAGIFIAIAIYLLATHQFGGLAAVLLWIGIAILYNGLYRQRRMLRPKRDFDWGD